MNGKQGGSRLGREGLRGQSRPGEVLATPQGRPEPRLPAGGAVLWTDLPGPGPRRGQVSAPKLRLSPKPLRAGGCQLPAPELSGRFSPARRCKPCTPRSAPWSIVTQSFPILLPTLAT